MRRGDPSYNPRTFAFMFSLLLFLPLSQPLRARLQNPQATYWDGSTLWIPDTGNAAIRAVLPAQQVGIVDWGYRKQNAVEVPRHIFDSILACSAYPQAHRNLWGAAAVVGR